MHADIGITLDPAGSGNRVIVARTLQYIAQVR